MLPHSWKCFQIRRMKETLHDCFSIKKLEKFTDSKVSVSHGGDVLWVPEVSVSHGGDVLWVPEVSVSHGGDVLWVPEVITEAACAIDITDFPLDTHNCTLSVCSGSRYVQDRGCTMHELFFLKTHSIRSANIVLNVC